MPFFRDLRQKLLRRLDLRVRLPPFLREPALHRRLEHRLAVASELGLGPLQRIDPGIQVAEKLLNLGSDTTLFWIRRKRYYYVFYDICVEIYLRDSLLIFLYYIRTNKIKIMVDK